MEEMNDVIKAAVEQAAPNLVVVRIEMQPIGSIPLEEKGQQAWQISMIVEDQNHPNAVFSCDS